MLRLGSIVIVWSGDTPYVVVAWSSSDWSGWRAGTGAKAGAHAPDTPRCRRAARLHVHCHHRWLSLSGTGAG